MVGEHLGWERTIYLVHMFAYENIPIGGTCNVNVIEI